MWSATEEVLTDTVKVQPPLGELFSVLANQVQLLAVELQLDWCNLAKPLNGLIGCAIGAIDGDGQRAVVQYLPYLGSAQQSKSIDRRALVVAH